RHRHARLADRSRDLHRDAAEAPGSGGRVSGRDRVPASVDRRRANARAHQTAREECLRAIPTKHSHGSRRLASEVTATALPEVKIIEPKVFGDARGFFFESFNALEFAGKVEPGVEFVQDNHSRSARGVLRGLHYQIEHAQGKLVR